MEDFNERSVLLSETTTNMNEVVKNVVELTTRFFCSYFTGTQPDRLEFYPCLCPGKQCRGLVG